MSAAGRETDGPDAESCFERVQVEFEPFDALGESFDGLPESEKQCRGIGVCDGVGAQVGFLHRPATGEEPIRVQRECAAECGDELGAGRLSAEVAADALVV